ncbi:MAG: hypothetical protein HOM51_10200 [Rhodospirillaceae bacterium]|jgi:hypothetical protein|nr:hypothetical protein [Rhodospirillaceae bacterium]
MRGEIIGVWSETWREVWKPLSEHPEYGDNLLPDIYRELVPKPPPPALPPPPEELNADGTLVLGADIVALEEYRRNLADFNAAQTRYEDAVRVLGRWLEAVLLNKVLRICQKVSKYDAATPLSGNEYVPCTVSLILSCLPSATRGGSVILNILNA